MGTRLRELEDFGKCHEAGPREPLGWLPNFVNQLTRCVMSVCGQPIPPG